MSENKKDNRPEARVAKGFRDIEAAELNGLNQMLQTIRGVYERYGFDALETPALEYTEALGKFLPDQDRPNAGVFSIQDEDEQWMSLRYDLTAPLARYVRKILTSCQSRSGAMRSALSTATKSQDRVGSANSCNSTPIRSAATASRPMPRCACWPRIRWKRSASSAATM